MKGCWAVAGTLVVLLCAVGCTGGESAAAEDYSPAAKTAAPPVDVKRELHTMSPAIPIYQGAEYRADLSRQDEAVLRQQYGPGSRIFTLATDDSFPQVWHYYVTYLAQYRSFEEQPPYPPEDQNWRSIEIPLNQAMQDPFIPGESLQVKNEEIVLQLAETESEPRTVIRYIVRPRPPGAEAIASTITTDGRRVIR